LNKNMPAIKLHQSTVKKNNGVQTASSTPMGQTGRKTKETTQHYKFSSANVFSSILSEITLGTPYAMQRSQQVLQISFYF
ncbi:hypothetical protein ACM91E_28445, partial [Escherichia coli]|uniref:hypothetical protein n=1 Tax=Escherichia coli TaxID=562 RepID=UPI003B9CE6AF